MIQFLVDFNSIFDDNLIYSRKKDIPEHLLKSIKPGLKVKLYDGEDLEAFGEVLTLKEKDLVIISIDMNSIHSSLEG